MKELSEENQQLIVNLYNQGTNLVKIRQITKFSGHTIQKYLLKNGIKAIEKMNCYRQCNVNDSYIDIIDTEDKAYFLGLMWSDGCNIFDKGSFCINLQEGDIDILEKLKDKLNYTGNIHILDKSKYKNNKNIANLHVNSRNISNKLNEYGCTQAKSLTIKSPSFDVIPQHLYKHFLRGCVDGDGSIYIGKDFSRHSYVSLVGSTFFIPEIFDKINYLLPNISSVHKVRKARKINHNDLGIYLVSGLHNIKKFLDFIYKDSNIHMNRRYNRYLEFLAKYEEKVIEGKIYPNKSKEPINKKFKVSS